MKEEILHCACHSLGHVSILAYDGEEKECYLSVHLTKLPWYSRIWHGIKYIFGFTSSYGDFEEFIWNEETVDKILLILKEMKADIIKEEVEKEG